VFWKEGVEENVDMKVRALGKGDGRKEDGLLRLDR
jgi:hypothetical protein